MIRTKTYEKSIMEVRGKVSIPLRRTVGLATLAPPKRTKFRALVAIMGRAGALKSQKGGLDFENDVSQDS